MSPQTGSRRYTHRHLKWFMGTSVFSTFQLQDFSFFSFLFYFLRVHKQHKNANKQISYFFPLRCLLSAFFIFLRLFTFCAFTWSRFCVLWYFLVLFVLFCVLCALWCFLCVRNIFIKKVNKKFKTPLITSFILLLNLSCYKHEFFNHYNLFQLKESFLIITIFSIISIFFNYYNFFNYHNFFNNPNFFQLSQFFSIITIFSKIFLIITIFFNYNNFFQL